ncbi:MAG: hypothetical protein ACODAE_07660 [Gemmatimonadota bacterium]
MGATLPTPLGVWGRVVLGLTLSVAMSQWPYPTCGLPLAGYMVAAATVLATGVWAGRASWRRRMGAAHVLAMGIVLAGITLVALEVLPRIGYAPVETAWRCLP